MLTGKRTKALYPGNGGDDPVAEGPSVDSWSAPVRAATGQPDRFLAALLRQPRRHAEVSTRHMSYSGVRAPMKPYYQPRDAYERLFGAMPEAARTTRRCARRGSRRRACSTSRCAISRACERSCRAAARQAPRRTRPLSASSSGSSIRAQRSRRRAAPPRSPRASDQQHHDAAPAPTADNHVAEAA